MLQIRFQITRCKNYRNRFRFAIAKSLTEVYCQVFSGPRCMIRHKYDDIALFSFVRLSSLWDSDILSQHRLTVWHGWILQISAVVVVANIGTNILSFDFENVRLCQVCRSFPLAWPTTVVVIACRSVSFCRQFAPWNSQKKMKLECTAVYTLWHNDL